MTTRQSEVAPIRPFTPFSKDVASEYHPRVTLRVPDLGLRVMEEPLPPP
jgi:hypothetical protein